MTPGTRFDFWAAALTAVTTAIAFAMAVLTLPKSGPFCVDGCLGYPYVDIATYIPRDFLWLYPALLPAPLFVAMLSGLHERVPAARKHFSRLALAFAMMAAAILTADYFIQLRVIQPAVLKGELDGLAPLTQYNPHGVFIALEEAGYVALAVSFLFAGMALSGDARYRVVRQVFIGGFVTLVVLFAALSIVYGFDVEYRFEVAAITVDWTVLIVTGAFMARTAAAPAVSSIARSGTDR
jgi:hypothetical protein